MEQAHESSAGIQVSKARWNSKRVLWALVCLQFLAVPNIFLIHLLPPVLGIGSFSIALDFRYVIAILWGATLSLFVLLPFLFAWSQRSLFRRASVYLTLMIAWAAVNILSFFLGHIFALGRSAYSIQSAVQELSELVGFAACFLQGVVVIPLAIRAHKGWQVADFSFEKVISRNERRMQWLALAAIVILIWFSGRSLETAADGIWVVLAVSGIVVGGVLSISAFWLLRDLSQSLIRILFAVNAILFIAVPGSIVLLCSLNLFSPFAGYEFICIGVLTAAAILLHQVICIRMSGYRMRKMEFVKASPVRVGKVVVDPFSD